MMREEVGLVEDKNKKPLDTAASSRRDIENGR